MSRLEIIVIYGEKYNVFSTNATNPEEMLNNLNKFVTNLSKNKFILLFKDDEEDWITLVTPDDLVECLNMAKLMQITPQIVVKNQKEEIAQKEPQLSSHSSTMQESQPLIDDLKENDIKGEDLVALVQNVQMRLRQGDDLTTAIHIGLSAHEQIAKHPTVQQLLLILPSLPPAVHQLSMMIAWMDPNKIAEHIENILQNSATEHPGLGFIQNLSSGAPPNQAANPFAMFCGQPTHNQNQLRADVVSKESNIHSSGIVNPGQILITTWRLKNTGVGQWPEGTRVVYSGQPFNPMVNEASFQIEAAASNEEVQCSIVVYAPKEPGQYSCTWRLETPNGQQFGEIIRIDSNVVQDTDTDICNDDCDPQDLDESSAFDIINQQLIGMGFVDVELNRMLLEEHHGNMQAVLNVLVDLRA